MGSNSKIEWTDHTFNPWIGCHKISPGCDNCYAESMARRNWPGHWGPPATTPRRMMAEAYWQQPFRWNAQAQRDGVRRRVFCASLADVWEPHPDVDEARFRLCVWIEATPHLDWLLLTKRPEVIRHLQPKGWANGWPRNAWAGTTVENQEQADRRIPHLLRLPAVVRFLSCEPLLGPVDMMWPLINAKTISGRFNGQPLISWVICGGESGHGARPMHPDWARSLRDQCAESGVAFFFKQHGNWLHQTQQQGEFTDLFDVGAIKRHKWPNHAFSFRVADKGLRLLDGVEHNEFPKQEE
jgi:protein gp37